MNDYKLDIQKSVDYIEDHLKDSISLEAVVECSGYSITHFYRIFHAITNYSLKEYIQQRRLSKAAYELATTKRRLIDIAFDYEFQSQEVFTRAFVRLFHITPASYRKGNEEIQICEKLNISELTQAKHSRFNNPPILLEKQFRLIGLEGEVKPGDSQIQILWDHYKEREHEILDKLEHNRTLGICEYTPNITDESTFRYMACCEVNSISFLPNGMTAKTIPLAKYAAFTHKGSMQQLKQTYDNIYGAWLPASDHKLAEMDTIECYSENELIIYIPIL